MNKKLLYIVPSWFTLSYHYRGQLSFLISQGFDVEVVCDPDPRAAKAALQEGVKSHHIIIQEEFNPIQDIIALYKLLRLIKRNKYNILNCSTKKGGFLGSLAARLTGSLSIYTVHGLFKTKFINQFKQRIFYHIERQICKLADSVIFVSRSLMELYMKKGLCPVHKGTVMVAGSVNGVDTQRFHKNDDIIKQSTAFRVKHNVPLNAFVFGYVGRLVVEKGIRELIDAWKIISYLFHDIHLILISPKEIDPHLYPQLKLITEDPRAHLIPFMEDPLIGYGAINCLLLPSYGEGFGTVILEANAMEIPVIASRVTGIIDAVVHEETGLLVNPRDSRSLACAMENVLNNQNMAKKLGENGRIRCLEFFQQEIMWRAYVNLYNNLHVK